MNKKVGKKIIGIGVGTLTFFLSLGCAYFLTPNRVKKGNFISIEKDEYEESHFMKFINTFAKDTGISESDENEREREYYGMHAEFENFALNFDNNTIAFDGDLDFLMRGMKDINFNMDLDVDWNTRSLPLQVGYINHTFYLGLKDLRMKVSSVTMDEVIGDPENNEYGLLYNLFVASEEEGGINFDIESWLDEKFNDVLTGLLGNFDLSNIAASFSLGGLEEGGTGVGVKVDERETTDGYDFAINLEIRREDEEGNLSSDSFDVLISVNKDYRLTRVDLGTIDLDVIKISGAINIDCIKDHQVISPEDVNYPKYNADYNYVEVINYKGWLQKIANFLNEDNQKFGLDFDFSLSDANTEIGAIKGNINADFSNIIDLSNYKVNKDGLKKNKLDLASKIRNDATFGLNVNMFGQNDVEYGNLSLKYVNGEGYINLNESLDEDNNLTSVLKAKIETETMNWIIDELPGMFKDVSDENNTTSALTSLFSFITESDLVKGIKDGDYSVVLDMLKELKNDDNGIQLVLDLSSVGLGDEATISLVLDARTGEDNKILNIAANNIEVGSLKLNASIKSNGYQDVVIGEESSYDSLSFLPTVFDQVHDIMGEKKLGFDINGSLLDSKNLGIVLNGEGQLDYGTKFGFGNLTIDQYKYENKGLWYSHKLYLDVDNRDGDYANNNVFFSYGDLDNKNIKGKVTVQSLLDMIDVFKTFIDDVKDNKKFTKFIDPIMKTLSLGEFSDIINSKDYFRFIKNDVLKSVRRNGNSIDIVIGGALFGMSGDMNVSVNLANDKLDSLEIKNVAIKEKTLNLKVSLKEYDDNKVSKLKESDAYIDFSTITLLVKFGLNTTKNDYYHLTATIDLNALAIINASFEMDVHVLIKDEYVKIYGIIPDAKLLNLLGSAVQDYGVTAQSVKSEFTFESYDINDPNREDGVGGYFHIKTTETKIITGRKVIKHFKTTSKNLIKSENIMAYLLNDLLLIKTSITDMIGNVSTDKDEYAPVGDFTNLFTSTGYSYNANKNQWKVGINLNEITGIDALRELELTINGRNDETLSSLVASLNIKASLVTIKLGADITLDTLDPTVTNWSNSIESAFNTINGVNFPESKLNQPFEYIEA
jgi:hypothetical protein